LPDLSYKLLKMKSS